MNSALQDVSDFFNEVLNNLRLIARLAADTRVPAWIKVVIPALVAVYLVSPIDILPDVIPGLGQLDDIAVILLGIKLFIDMSPPDVVRQHLDELQSFRSKGYRVVTEDPSPPEEEKKRKPSGYIETSYTVVEDE
jgi:uncharacterized membrane protein YkvA (DUF1232 family)